MRILITTAWYPTSTSMAGIFVKEQADALAQQGHDVCVLLVNYRGFGSGMRSLLSKTEQKRYLRSPGVTLLETDIRLPFTRLSSDPLGKQKKRITQEAIRITKKHYGDQPPSLIHHHCLSDNAYVAEALAREWNVPCGFTEHSPYTSYRELKKFNRFESQEDHERFVRNAAFRIGVSRKWADVYSAIFNAPFMVVPNMVSTLFEAPLVRITTSPFTFACVGSFDANKNQEMLIRAFDAVFGNAADVHLVLAGEGARKKHCELLAQSLVSGTRISFPGMQSREEVVKLFDRSNVVVSVSDKETFGIVLAEGMFRGRPVIATRSGGPEEFVTPENGMLVPTGDVTALKDAMLAMHAAWNRFSPEAIASSAKAKSGTKAVMKQLLEIYASASSAQASAGSAQASASSAQ